MLATWGDGEFGQLGIGSSTPADSPQHDPKLLRGAAVAAPGGSSSSSSSSGTSSSSSSSTAGLRFIRVVAGAARSFALTSNGGVFSFGQVGFVLISCLFSKYVVLGSEVACSTTAGLVG
jgi:alpha-tubulin suppressor-like RCC1 family protein